MAGANPDRAGPVLVVVAGPSAGGKTRIARALAGRLGARRLEADRIGGTLFAGLEEEPGGAEARWRRDLPASVEPEIYADLLRRADGVLAGDRALVVDACFPEPARRDEARALAQRHDVPFLLVECREPDADAPPADPAEPWRIGVCSAGPTETALDAILARLGGAIRLPDVGAARLVSAPRVVSFDCWNTLLTEEDWDWAHGLRVSALAQAAREAGLSLAGGAADQAFTRAWQRHMDLWEEGRVSAARDVARWALAELGLEDPQPALDHLVRRFEEASHTSRVVALDGARPLLRALGRAGVGRVLVCDTGLTPGRVVRRLLDGAGLLDALEVLAFSDEVGFPKPDQRTFLAAIEPLGVAPEEVLHVGDLRRTDVAGARSLGMQSVRIRGRHDDVSPLPDADHVVDSHAELAALLGVRVEES